MMNRKRFLKTVLGAMLVASVTIGAIEYIKVRNSVRPTESQYQPAIQSKPAPAITTTSVESIVCETCQYREGSICKDYKCCSDLDCDDRNSQTEDICESPSSLQSFCQNKITLCGGAMCSGYKECVNNKCMLKYTTYKLGLVYIYNTPDTYNPNWRSEFEIINKKVKNALKEVTENKVDVSIEILGEVQTDTFCWNPATIGGTYMSEATKELFNFAMPGSGFSNVGVGLTGWKIVESYCPNCIIEKDIYKMSCNNNLSYENLWETNKLSQLNKEISKKIEFSFKDYDGVYIIFGKLGQIIPEDETTLRYRCTSHSGVIGGYSNLIMAENSIKAGGFINCNQFGAGSFYDKMGWHQMVHEILHRFGAVDIYETGSTFGISSEREQALALDPKADGSIMGNDYKSCMENGDMELDGNVCSQSELEKVYLDKYNRQKIGLK